MGKDTKTKILETARNFFYQKGYNAVSMRDIARASQISVGNVTYYFPKKEILAEKIILWQHEKNQGIAPPESLEALQEFFLNIIQNQRANAFYFKNYTQLTEISAEIFRSQQQFVFHKYNVLLESFCLLREKNLLKKEQFPEQSSFLADALISLCVFGLAKNEERPLECLWTLLYPQLDKKGRKKYKKSIKPKLHFYETVSEELTEYL